MAKRKQTKRVAKKRQPRRTDWRQVYEGQAVSQIAFPLGGIGTGTVSLGGYGQLRDWEIFNRPSKGRVLPYSFFAIRCRRRGGRAVTKVLEAQRHPPCQEGTKDSSDQAQSVAWVNQGFTTFAIAP